MTDSPTDRWEFSLLVDQSSRILEARGLFEFYLGARTNQLIGRHLLSYFDDTERLGFLRYMARLLIHGNADPVAASLRTPAVGFKRFSMAARQGEGGHSWWIMFSQQEKSRAAAQELGESGSSFATEAELAALADAHDAAKAPLDLTVFRADALSADHPKPLSPGERRKIDDRLGETLLDHAHQRVVARPEIGEFALLHLPEKSAEQIGQSLAAAVERHNLPAELGLTHETRALSNDTSAAALILDIRHKIRNGTPTMPERRGAPQANTKWVPAAIAGGCGLILILLWLWLPNGL